MFAEICGEREISLLDIHHIMPRNQGGPNEEINLILVCKKCHTDIEDGKKSVAEVMKKKQELIQGNNNVNKSQNISPIFNINQNKINSSVIANTVNFKGKKPSKISHPIGRIGADIDMNNYIKYLVDKYFKYRKADSSYGRFGKFSYGELHSKSIINILTETLGINNQRYFEIIVSLLTNPINEEETEYSKVIREYLSNYLPKIAE